MRELPRGWEIVQFDNVCEIISGKNQKDVINDSGAYPIYGSGGRMGYANDFLCDAGTTIVGRKGTINKPIFVNEKFWNVDTAFGFSPVNGVDKLFFYFYCLSYNFKKLDKSTTIPSLAKTDLLQIKIPLPPSLEQQRIVAKIEELFSSLDKGIESIKTAQDQLKIYRQAVLKWAFEGKLTNGDLKKGELPPGWEWEPVKDICLDIKVGIVIQPSRFYSLEDCGVKVFRSANVKEFYVNDSKWVYFTEEGNNLNYRTQVFEGDVLVVRSGYPGTSCVVPLKFHKSNAIDIIIARVNRKSILPGYLCAFNNSPYAQKTFLKQSRGSAQKHLNIGEYEKVLVPIPSLWEQSQIVAEIESRLSVCDKLEESINQSLQQAEALRQSILKKAFEGKLVPQDPNDEPASVLLERIRAERAAVGAKNATTGSRNPGRKASVG